MGTGQSEREGEGGLGRPPEEQIVLCVNEVSGEVSKLVPRSFSIYSAPSMCQALFWGHNIHLGTEKAL